MLRNDVMPNASVDLSKLDGSGGVESNGIWKLHISIAPEDMLKAIPILHRLFFQFNSIPMGMKIATNVLLAQDHQSAKEVALIFDRVAETSEHGRQQILMFLALLAHQFELAGIRPEEKPPLTVETKDFVRLNGSELDRRNLERGKYDAKLRFREHEALSYFNYRDEWALLFEDDVYDMIYPESPLDEQQRMVKKSEFDRWSASFHPEYKHNPLKRKDDFLYGVILEKIIDLTSFHTEAPPQAREAEDLSNAVPPLASDIVAQPDNNVHKPPKLVINVTDKASFLTDLALKLSNPALSRADILDLFAQIKTKDGNYRLIHEQRHPSWDRFRLFFKSSVAGQNEANFWHTATYQQAVKLLKQAYVARGAGDQSEHARQQEAHCFIDYVRGNSPFHYTVTSTRSLLS